MTIASEISKLNTNLINSYTAVSGKGGTLPQAQNFDNLATAISSIPSGTTPTGTLSITANGVYDVTNYASANVNVSGGSATVYLVQVIDYDGTVLKSERLDEGDTFTLPTQPSHTGLVFDGWSSPVTITNNTVSVTNSDITIGATYTTASGLSEFDITLTKVTGLSVTLNMNGTKNWGDGTSDTSTTHTYSSVGDYTITCNGTTMTTSSSSGLFGQTISTLNYYATNVRLGSGVTSIGTYAFQNCFSLTSITIPDGVTSIGNYAFYMCRSLTSITIPDGVTSIGNYAFYMCHSLTSITIPDSVTNIGTYAFYMCRSLISITIPDSVTSIGSNAFYECYSLTSITIPEGVTSIGTYAFYECCSLTSIIIPEGVTSIGDNAFYMCYSLTSITIPEGVTNIGNYAFYNCYSLTSIIIPDSVTSIGDGVFYSCLSLTSITIPEGVTSIGTYEFTGCYSLTSIIIPDSVTSIGNYAFQSCYSLTSIIIPEGVTSIGVGAFYNCYSLTSITIPGGVTSIGSNAFSECLSLTSITIPEGVTNINSNSFSDCFSLTSIIIPDSVTSIGSNAFSSCYSLTSIIIPDSVTSIGSNAFQSCYSLIEYNFSNHSSVPTLPSIDAFTGINGICKIYVPWDLYNNWKAATNWSTYADYISNKNPATLNFTVTPSNSTIYVNGSQIQGTSSFYVGSTVPYVVYSSTNNVVLSNSQTGITEGATVNITADLTSYKKITLSTGVSDLDVNFTLGGVSFNATDEGNGNYSINVVGSGVNVGYNIDGGSTYLSEEGQITTTGSNITENITMQEITWQTFTRPNLTADGTLGGNSFAVSSSSVYSTSSSYQAWRAVDGSTSTSYYWYSNSTDSIPTYTFYNPNILNVSQIVLVYTSTSYRASDITIQGSNDNSTWTDISSSYSGTSSGTLTVTNDKGYKYHRLVFTRYGSYIRLSEMVITAQEGV